MGIKVCCDRMSEHRDIDIHQGSYPPKEFTLDFDSYMFGEEVFFCPFCGNKLEIEEG